MRLERSALCLIVAVKAVVIIQLVLDCSNRRLRIPDMKNDGFFIKSQFAKLVFHYSFYPQLFRNELRMLGRGFLWRA